MGNWIVTVPKTVKWEDYEKELLAAESCEVTLRYRVRYRPKGMGVHQRLYILWDGRVRGWMHITGINYTPVGFICTTTGKSWPPSWYIERTGPFYKVEGPKMKGFRGVRRFNFVGSILAPILLGV